MRSEPNYVISHPPVIPEALFKGESKDCSYEIFL